MKKLFSNRTILVGVIILVLIVSSILVWMRFFSKNTVDADINSSNGSHYALVMPKGFQPADLVMYDSSKYLPSFQYESKPRRMHVMVIDESKAKIISFGLDYDLETYMKIASRQLDSTGLYVNKPIRVNGFKALQTEIRGVNRGEKQVYVLTCIESPKFFYQLLIWSSEDHYESNRADINMIVNSFREQGEAPSVSK